MYIITWKSNENLELLIPYGGPFDLFWLNEPMDSLWQVDR